MTRDVWYIPLGRERSLIYAPFHGITILANQAMAKTVFRCLEDRSEPVPEKTAFIETLREPGKRPDRKRGLPDPLFLGLIPTRGCMMQCAYCDFVTLLKHPVMSFDLIRKAVDGYSEIMQQHPGKSWNIHFFGGEPFAAFKEVVFAVNYARQKAALLGAGTHFEVTTNGYYSEETARWIAENIDTVVLSLDGFPETQNYHRPGPGGKESFSTVCRNADIFSDGSCELFIRSCVSAENVEKLPEWAALLAERWVPEGVCLEPMIESPLARKHGLIPPDPFVFIQNWAAAYRILSEEKIRLVYSSGDISQVKNSLCPLGQDALIISSEGAAGGCWQLSEYQEAGGADLQFGSVDPDGLHIDQNKFEKIRQMSEDNRNRCRGCFCYAHCAGGCLLNHERDDNFCRITKNLTLWQLLEQIGSGPAADELLSNKAYTEWLADEEDFFSCVRELPADPQQLPDGVVGTGERIISEDLNVIGSLPVSADPIRGWLRDGERILTADVSKNDFRVLEGEDALRFQLEHSGLKASEVTVVRAALMEERN